MLAFAVVFFAVTETGGAQTSASSQRTIPFSGFDWTVRSSRGPTDPGGNTFSANPSDVWVDERGFLHLTLGESATEVRTRRSLGYGTYEVRLLGALDRLHPRAVLGFFTFELPSTHPHHREIDIEFSRWGLESGPNLQYVVQPADRAGNRRQMSLPMPEGEATTHRFTWEPGAVTFTSWHGHGDYPPPAHLLIAHHAIRSADVPDPRRERLYLNFWWYQGPPDQPPRQSVIVTEFQFIPRP